MSTSMIDKDEPTGSQEAVIDEVEQAMGRLKISPIQILGSLRHLRIDRARIEPIESQIPEMGGTADVEAAILAPAQSSNPSNPDDVEYIAVKKVRLDAENDSSRALAPFAHELKLLSDLSHENIVKIIGFVEDVERGIAWIVFSWEKNGNLREFVRSANWELPERVSLISDVTEGLSYLHGRSPPICHGDMKSLNILVNRERRAVITDFGSARPVASPAAPTTGTGNAKTPRFQQQPSTHAEEIGSPSIEVTFSGEFITMSGPTWSVRWAAPELLGGHESGLAADIWALGWVCWEAITGNFPFDNLQDGVAVVVRIVKGDLPAIKNDGQLKQLAALCGLMRECWTLDASKRPTAPKCLGVVALMDQAVPSPKQGDNSDIACSSELLHALGRIRMRNGMMLEACKYFVKSLEISNSVGDERGRARALVELGHVHALQGDYSKAEKSFIEGRCIYAEIGESLGFAESTKFLGDVYRMRAEYSKAEATFSKLWISKWLGNPHLAILNPTKWCPYPIMGKKPSP